MLGIFDLILKLKFRCSKYIKIAGEKYTCNIKKIKRNKYIF